MFIDSHCHINFTELHDNIAELVQNMHTNKVTHALCAAVSLEDFPDLIQKIHALPNFYASVGVHPDYEDVQEPSVDELVTLSQLDKVIAIGETGLDYYRLQEHETIADLDWQRTRFRTHIQAANQVNKPLIIHSREARDDTLRIMQEEQADKCKGVLHCFTDTYDMAVKALDMGFYISFSGIVTFKSAKDLQDTAKKLPLDRILIETDAPYLAPMPHRGKVNQPAWVMHVAEFLAELRQEPLQKIAEQTTQNFFDLFKHAGSI
jgi:TatD DNase family protein